MAGRKRSGRSGGRRGAGKSPRKSSTRQAAPPPAARVGGPIHKGAAVAAVVSTAVLFGLMLIALWVGDTVYEALPLGPLPRSRVVSAGATLLTLGAGVGLIYLLAFAARRVMR